MKFYKGKIVTVLCLYSLFAQSSYGAETCAQRGLTSGSYPSGPGRVVLNEANAFKICGSGWSFGGKDTAFYSSEDGFLSYQPYSHWSGTNVCAIKNVIFDNPASLGSSWVLAETYNCRDIKVQGSRPFIAAFSASNVAYASGTLTGKLGATAYVDNYSLNPGKPLYKFETRCFNSGGAWTTVSTNIFSNVVNFTNGCDFQARVTVSDGAFESIKTIDVLLPSCARTPVTIGVSCNGENWCAESFGRACSSAGGTTWFDSWGAMRCTRDAC